MSPRQVRRMKRIFNPNTTLDSIIGFRQFLILVRVCPSTLTSVISKGTTLFPWSVLSKLDEDWEMRSSYLSYSIHIEFSSQRGNEIFGENDVPDKHGDE